VEETMSASRIIVWSALASTLAFGCSKDGATTRRPEPESEGTLQDVDATLQEANRAVEESIDEADDELEDASKDVDEEIGRDQPD
jgi:hypothetical protein